MHKHTHARTHRPCIWLLNSESRQLNRGRFRLTCFSQLIQTQAKLVFKLNFGFRVNTICVFSIINLFFPFFTSLFTLRYKIDQRSIILVFFNQYFTTKWKTSNSIATSRAYTERMETFQNTFARRQISSLSSLARP